VSDLKVLNQIAPRFMTQALSRNQCSHGLPQKFFQRGGFFFAYPFQFADNAAQMEVHKTLYPVYTLVCTG